MTYTRRQATSMAALTLLWPSVRAQAGWPNKPLRIVTGGAGGVTDIRARWLADRLGAALGQPVVVENNGAAGGNVGAEQVARSAPDGYTLLLIHQGTAAVNPHLYPHTGYNPLADFAPLTRFGYGSLLMVVHRSVPATSVTVVRFTPSICAMNSCVSGRMSDPSRSWHMSSHFAIRCSTT